MGFIMITEDMDLDIEALGLRVGQYVEVIAVGGGGGGGGGAGGIYTDNYTTLNVHQHNKAIMDFFFNDDPVNNFFNVAAMTGTDGTDGTDTTFGDLVIAKGGAGGKGGSICTFNFNKNTTNATYYNAAWNHYTNDVSNNAIGGAGGAGFLEDQGYLTRGGKGGNGHRPYNMYYCYATGGYPICGGGGGGGGAAGQFVKKCVKLNEKIIKVRIGQPGVGGQGGKIYNGYLNFGLGTNIARVQINMNSYFDAVAEGQDMSQYNGSGFNRGVPYGFSNWALYRAGDGGNAGYGGIAGNGNWSTNFELKGAAGDGGFGFGAGGGGGGGFAGHRQPGSVNNSTLTYGMAGGGGGGGMGYQVGELRRRAMPATNGGDGYWGSSVWNQANQTWCPNASGGGRGGYSAEYNHITGTPSGRAGINQWNYTGMTTGSSAMGMNGVCAFNNAHLGKGLVLVMW